MQMYEERKILICNNCFLDSKNWVNPPDKKINPIKKINGNYFLIPDTS